jgi:hypothetical protein
MRTRLWMALLLLPPMSGCVDRYVGADPYSLMLVGEVPDSVLPGSVLDTITIEVLGRHGEPVVGAAVSWSGAGTLHPLDSRTDGSGRARLIWTLPRITPGAFDVNTGPPGPFSIAAHVNGSADLHLSTTGRAFRVEQVAAAGFAACGIKAGRLWCWSGGDSEPAHPWLAVLPPEVLPRRISANAFTVCVVDQNSAVWCGRVLPGATFSRVSALPQVDSLAGRGREFCTLSADRAAWCWVADDESLGTALKISDGPFVQVTVGWGSACALAADGGAWCWGDNSFGQLGDGTLNHSVVPVAVGGGHQFRAIGAGDLRTCGLTFSGQLFCWGRAFPDVRRLLPTPLGVSTFTTTVLVMSDHAVHLLENGRIRSVTETGEYAAPYAFAEIRMRSISASDEICGIAMEGDVYCSQPILMPVSNNLFPADALPVPWPKP